MYGPLIFYTDNCCKEFDVICSVWNHLATRKQVTKEGSPVIDDGQKDTNSDDSILETSNVFLVDSVSKVASAVEDLRSAKELGMDLEWKVLT